MATYHCCEVQLQERRRQHIYSFHLPGSQMVDHGRVQIRGPILEAEAYELREKHSYSFHPPGSLLDIDRGRVQFLEPIQGAVEYELVVGGLAYRRVQQVHPIYGEVVSDGEGHSLVPNMGCRRLDVADYDFRMVLVWAFAEYQLVRLTAGLHWGEEHCRPD